MQAFVRINSCGQKTNKHMISFIETSELYKILLKYWFKKNLTKRFEIFILYILLT